MGCKNLSPKSGPEGGIGLSGLWILRFVPMPCVEFASFGCARCLGWPTPSMWLVNTGKDYGSLTTILWSNINMKSI